MAIKQVKLSEVLSLLKSGYTRWETDATEPTKSIETYYGLSGSDARALFAHAKIKRVKTKIITLEIIDDVEEPEVVLEIEDDTAELSETSTFQAQLGAIVEPAPLAVQEAPEPVLEEEVDIFG